MTEDDYEALSEGRATITETARTTVVLLREQLVAEAVGMTPEQRYAFAVGSLLAWVPEDVKAELLGLIRHGLPTEVEA